MSSKNVFRIMIGGLALLIAVNVGAVVFGSRFLKSHSGTLSELKLESSTLDEQQNLLTNAKKDIENYKELEEIAKSVVPQDKDQAKVVREIVAIAEKNNVKLAGVSFPASTLGQAAPKPATPAEGDTAPKVTTPPLTQVKTVEGIKDVYSLEIIIQQDTTSPITYETFINFLSDLENNRRTAHVSNISVQPSAIDRNNITFSLTLNAYIKP